MKANVPSPGDVVTVERQMPEFDLFGRRTGRTYLKRWTGTVKAVDNQAVPWFSMIFENGSGMWFSTKEIVAIHTKVDV